MALCKYPYYEKESKLFFGCGKCHMCRINKRREWTARLILEATQHEKRAFITLTYNDEHLPQGGELNPIDLTNFLKRLRKSLSEEQRKIRYYACGEYGEKNLRPHYHAIIFGLDCTEAEVVQKNWALNNLSMGKTLTGSVTTDSMAYTAGYVQKKNFKKLSGERDIVEFARMSTKPPIGKTAIIKVAEQILSSGHIPSTMQVGGDCPSSLRIGGKNMPIGRTLKTILRRELKLNEEAVKEISLQIAQEETEENIKEVLSSPEYATEVMQIKTSGLRTTHWQKKQSYMRLYNRNKIALSEKLSKIYLKARTLDQ